MDDSVSEHASEHVSESDGSWCHAEYLANPEASTSNSSTLLCFHGSGTSHLHNWQALLVNLSLQYPTVFFDRGPQNPTPEVHNKVLWAYLRTHELKGPYTLIAHSYGGVFAKHFLHAHRESVRGMVLLETGKGGSPDSVLAPQIKERYLGHRPLSVVRANSFLLQWQALEADIVNQSTTANSQVYKDKKDWLTRCAAEDEKLEKDQLRLSHNSRLVHLPDCGHNIVRDRPDVVLQEVQWVLEQSQTLHPDPVWLASIRRIFSTTRRI